MSSRVGHGGSIHDSRHHDLLFMTCRYIVNVRTICEYVI